MQFSIESVRKLHRILLRWSNECDSGNCRIVKILHTLPSLHDYLNHAHCVGIFIIGKGILASIMAPAILYSDGSQLQGDR